MNRNELCVPSHARFSPCSGHRGVREILWDPGHELLEGEEEPLGGALGITHLLLGQLLGQALVGPTLLLPGAHAKATGPKQHGELYEMPTLPPIL